jgi:dihydroorotase
MYTLIKDARLVNEGVIQIKDVLIKGERIQKIAKDIVLDNDLNYIEIDAKGFYLIPGIIDAQVHFREPGFTHKADIETESKAAVAGGVTSYMDMPNTHPSVLTQELLEQKYALASAKSHANYSFFMGVGRYNLDAVLRTNNENVCGVSDDGLYFDDDEGIVANHPEFLEQLFSRSNSLIALHSEDDSIINSNIFKYKAIYGDNIPVSHHPKIRSEAACVTATKRVLEIAKKYSTRLHLLHLTTAIEAEMFSSLKISEKRITSEVSAHHLYFSEEDYHSLGNRIKWNPAIKSSEDKEGLMKALLNDKIDMITTDHAPHTWTEKKGNYFEVKSGGPLVQHSLQMMISFYEKGLISLEKIVQKMCHHVADTYKIKERGYIREGYYADLVLVDLNATYIVSAVNLLSKCNWSPLEGEVFCSQVTHTWVNGQLAFNNSKFLSHPVGKRLQFEKDR